MLESIVSDAKYIGGNRQKCTEITGVEATGQSLPERPIPHPQFTVPDLKNPALELTAGLPSRNWGPGKNGYAPLEYSATTPRDRMDG